MFEIHTKNTYEEYLRATQTITAARKVYYKSPSGSRIGLYILLAVCIVFEVFSIWEAEVNHSEWFSAFAVFLGMLICLYLWMIFTAKERTKNAFKSKQAEKQLFDIWNSDKQMRDCDETIRFDEDGIEVVRSFSSMRIGYDCIYKLVETQTNIYILFSMNRFCNVKKENVTPEQYGFIISHCCPEGDSVIKL